MPQAKINRVQSKKQIGTDGASLDGKSLHSANGHESVTLPANLNEVMNTTLEQDFNSLIKGNTVEKIKGGTAKIKSALGDSGTAFGKIFHSLGETANQGSKALISNPNIITGVAGLGAVYTGVRSLKNILKTFSSFMDPKSEPVPWLMYGLQGILQGGLAVGLASPFLNLKSPFVKIINGRSIVQVKTVVGAAIATIIVSIFMNMAKGISLFNKLPFIGKPLKDISATLNNGLKEISTNTGSDQNAPGGNLPALPPGIGAPQQP